VLELHRLFVAEINDQTVRQLMSADKFSSQPSRESWRTFINFVFGAYKEDTSYMDYDSKFLIFIFSSILLSGKRDSFSQIIRRLFADLWNSKFL
jgi:hypothetical protein